MGSFNTSCMVTQQTIVPNAEAVILPIIQQATYNPVEMTKDGQDFSQYGFAHTTCYPTAFWGYCGPMFRGTYDDYGRFDLDDTPENKINLVSFFNHLLDKSFTTKQGENQYHDHGFDMAKLFERKKEYTFAELESIWEAMWDVTFENRLFVANYQGEPRNLQFAVMHRAAADYLIDTVNQFKGYDKKSYEQKTYFTNYVQDQLSRMIGLFKHKKELGDTFSFFGTQLSSLSSYLLGQNEGCYIGHYYDSFNEIMDLIDEHVKNNPQTETVSKDLIDKLFDIFKVQLDHRYIHEGLNYLNIKLSPMVYASQDYDNSVGKAYAKMIRSVSSQINKEIKANW